MPDLMEAQDSAVIDATAGGAPAHRAVQPLPPRTVVAEVAPAIDRHPPAPLRQRRRLSIKTLSFVSVVILPTIAAALYLGFVASQQYVAEYRVSIRSVDPIQTSAMSTLLGLGGMSQAGQSSYAVVQYLRSRKAIDDLDQSIGLGGLYRSSSIDWLSRLRDSDGVETFVRYWQRMMDAFYEPSTSTIVVKVHAFRPADAFAIATASLKLSEGLVNAMSERTRNDSVRVAEDAVEQTHTHLIAVGDQIRQLQNSDQVLDPRKSAEATMTLLGKVREQLIEKSSQLAVARRSLDETAPSVVELKAEIAALEVQRDRLYGENTQTDTTQGVTISAALAAFGKLEAERTFQEKLYQSELAALQQARLEAGRQQLYLAVIVPPEMPELSDYPRPILGSLTAFAICLALWIIGVVGVSAVREHI